MKNFVINLEHRKDRLQQVAGEFVKANMVADVDVFKAFKDDIPQRGCGNSHIACIKLAKERGYDMVGIYEDDFYWLNDGWKYMDKCLEQLPKDFDIFFPGANTDNKPAYQYSENLAKPTSILAMHSYVVNAKYYDAFLDPDCKTSNVLDWYINKFFDKTNWYIAIPMLTGQRTGYSDIEKRQVNYTEGLVQRYNKDLILKK